jgi:hypothetical protein
MLFNVTPIGNCSILSTMPSVSSTGMLTYQPAPDAFGQCTFNVSLCVFRLCSIRTPLTITINPGKAGARVFFAFSAR